MKFQNLFSGTNKKNISESGLLKILPRMLSCKVVHSKRKEFTSKGCKIFL